MIYDKEIGNCHSNLSKKIQLWTYKTKFRIFYIYLRETQMDNILIKWCGICYPVIASFQIKPNSRVKKSKRTFRSKLETKTTI